MAHFIISYDLHNQRTYPPVWKLLESWGAVRLLESLWVVSLNIGPAWIREQLKAVMDSDDAVAVIELKTGSDWSTQLARTLGNNWLTTNIRNYG